MWFAVEELELIKGQVREGEARVQRQREIVIQLKGRDLPARAAEILLANFEDALARDRARLDQGLLKEQAARCGDAFVQRVI